MNYEPLKIDVNIEDAGDSSDSCCSSFRQLLEYVFNRLHIRITPFVPYGRKSIVAQLNKRILFPSKEWIKAGFNIEEVITILKIIKEEFNLPNYNIIPEDVLSTIFIPDFDDFTLAWLSHRIRVDIGTEMSKEEIGKYITSKWNVKQFVNEVISRTNPETT